MSFFRNPSLAMKPAPAQGSNGAARPDLLPLVIFYGAYVLAGGFGQGLAIIPGVSITFWPPAGIFIAMLLLNPRASWAWWIAAAGLAELTCNTIWFHNPIPLALIYFVGNAATAVLAAWLICAVIKREFRLDTLDQVLAFIILGAMLAPVASATVIATVDHIMGRHDFLTAWPLVWLGDGSGILVSTPLALAVVQTWRKRDRLAPGRIAEAVAIAVLLVTLEALSLNDYLPTAYLTLPLLVWSAVRFQLRGAAIALALLAVTTSVLSISGVGTFVGTSGNMKETIVALQTFLAVSAISTLVVAVLSMQHQRALGTLKDANSELEARVSERTALLSESEARLNLALAAAHAGTWQHIPETGEFTASERATELMGLPKGTALNHEKALAAVYQPDQQKVAQAIEQSIATGRQFRVEFRARQPDGSMRWLLSQAELYRKDGHSVFVGLVQDISESKQAEEQIEAGRNLLNTVMQSSPDCIWLKDLDGRLTLANQATLDLLGGGDPSRVINRPHDEIVPDAEQARRIRENDARIIASGQAETVEEALGNPDAPLIFQSTKAPLRDAAGNVIGIVGVTRDITENKHAELALRESERRLAAVLDALPIGVALVDRSGVPLIHNEVFSAYVQDAVPSSPAGETSLWEGYDDSGRRIEKQDFPTARALRGERVWPGQDFIYHGNAQRGPVWTRVAAIPFRDENAGIIGASVVIMDVDAEKRASEMQARSSDTYYRLIKNNPFGLYLVDADFRLAQFSLGAEKVFANVKPALGRDFTEILKIIWTEPFSTQALARFRHTLETGEPFHARDTIQRRGDTQDIEAYDWKIERVTLPDGRFGVVCYFYDMTERRRYEQRINLLMREVNHRSKNILSLVQAIARQTAAGDPDDFLNRFQQRIMALSAGQDLLINSGWSGVNLEELVRAQLAHFGDLVGKRISIEGPALTVNAAAAQTLGLAIHELATNAGKYGALSNKRGRVQINWSLGLDDGSVERFQISWIERGGPKVAAPRRNGFGTAVINRMSKLALDAQVMFDLDENGLVWRLQCVADRVLEGRQHPSTTESQQQQGEASPAGKRILIVEDEAVVAYQLAAELEKAGFIILGPASDVSQAMRLLDQHRCESAVLDINLGSATSEPVAARLKELRVPFITVSGYSREQRPQLFRDVPFIPKPLDHERLIEVLTSCIDNATATATASHQ